MWYFTFSIVILIALVVIVKASKDEIELLRNQIQQLRQDLAAQKVINSELRTELYHSQFRRATNCSNSHRPVVFQARLSSSIYPLGFNQIITYDSTVTNEGNAYDALTGIFEATVGGLYQFMATMWSEDGYNVDFQMMFNGAEVCAGRATSTNQSMGICSAILQVPNGGRVFVRHKGTTGNYALGGNYAEFAGHLIM
nr:C1q-related factor-like [Crassostrea gigas]